MLRHLRTFFAALAVVGLLAAPATTAFAGSNIGTLENEKAPPMVDLMLMRPLGLVGLVVSGVVWVPVQAFTMAILMKVSGVNAFLPSCWAWQYS